MLLDKQCDQRTRHNNNNEKKKKFVGQVWYESSVPMYETHMI